MLKSYQHLACLKFFGNNTDFLCFLLIAKLFELLIIKVTLLTQAQCFIEKSHQISFKEFA